MTREEEEKLSEAIFAEIVDRFDYLDDESAQLVVNAVKEVTEQKAAANLKASREQKTIEYAQKRLAEEIRQKNAKAEEIKWQRTADQRERERRDALEKMRRAGDYGLRYDADGNSNQRIPEPEEYNEFLNPWERNRR